MVNHHDALALRQRCAVFRVGRIHHDERAVPAFGRPLLDFEAGYVKRSVDTLPRQGDTFPWQMTFDYDEDKKMMRRGRVLEPELRLSPLPQTEPMDGDA